MKEIINILLVSSVPAFFTGIITYLTSARNAKIVINSLVENNKHEIEKLMKQHEIDIESLKEKHQLEIEKSEQEHKHNIEIKELEHRNEMESKEKEQSNAAMFGVMTDMIKEPEKLAGLMKLMNNPILKNN